ncbi:MAG: tol-pal system protein YbgF [Pseudomonadota bacterium]
MKLIKVSVLLLGFAISAVAYAIAPVVDAYNDDGDNDSPSSSRANTASNNVSTFSQEQRVAIVERQIANLNPLLVQVDDINQRMQELRGRIDEQDHRLKRLEEQVRSQYQDLEKRFTQRQLPLSTTKPSSMGEQRYSTPATGIKNATPTARSSSTTNLPTAVGENDYQAAFRLLKNKQYAPAIMGFENFIKKYPLDVNRSNASYFLGQLYLLQGQPEQSIFRFNDFVNKYSQDVRVPDALLQLGLAYFAKGDKEVAIDTFEKIIKRYPDSKAADSAKARLQQFQAMISAANLSSQNKA